jgi:two-component system NtrC family sensor kinase
MSDFIRDRLRDLSLQRKLTFIIVTITLVATLAASLAFVAFQAARLRSSFRDDVVALSKMVADNAIGSVSFGDATVATEVISSLRQKKEIVGAVIDLPAHPDFAHYGEALPPAWHSDPTSSVRYFGWHLLVAVPIGKDASEGGALHVEADFRPVFLATLLSFGLSLFAILVLVLLVALFGVSLLQGVILAPIEQLAHTARNIAAQPDYSVRAQKHGNDEIGLFTDAFNLMLDRLHEGDLALRASTQSLTAEIAERKSLQTRLIESSRLAGMAQVATGVLHNVGNVLNSVNVSANLMFEGLTECPPLKLLQQTSELLRAQGDDLPRFLAEDTRGKLVAPFIIRLAAQFAGMRDQMIEEVGKLMRNIEHIKEIVAMQQTYAKAGGVMERVDATELFDAAVHINQASLTRHSVEVIREFTGAPVFTTERHQVLQTLINFISNAAHAVARREIGNRRIRLRLEADQTRVRFAVEDNGVGIAAENLPRIFQHGFTTRADGHGFGLHASALAIRNLGGRVAVHSAGQEQGARFTLDLPVNPPLSTSLAA